MPDESEPTGQAAPQYPHPYPYPPGGYPPAWPRNGLGVASLVIAIAALVLVWSVVGAIILGIVGAILGFLGRQRVKRGEANNGGIAIAGIVLGLIAVVVGLVFASVWYAVWRQAGGDDYVDCLHKAGSDRVRQQQCADQFRDKVQDQFGVTATTAPPTP